MKKNISNKLPLIGLLVIFGCSSKKLVVLQKPVKPVKTDSVATVVNTPPKPADEHLTADQLTAIKAKQIDFITFSAKAKAKLNIDGAANDATLNIRIKKKTEIWISITGPLGLEGARALITPDSIKIIDRLNATYTKRPFSYLYQYASSQVSYATLEALIIGNAWPGLVSDSSIVQHPNGALALNGAVQDLIYQLLLDSDMRTVKTTLSSRGIVARNLQVDFSGAIKAADRILPAQININTSAPNSKVSISMTYTKADFNTNVEFPFTVPSRYSVVN